MHLLMCSFIYEPYFGGVRLSSSAVNIRTGVVMEESFSITLNRSHAVKSPYVTSGGHFADSAIKEASFTGLVFPEAAKAVIEFKYPL